MRQVPENLKQMLAWSAQWNTRERKRKQWIELTHPLMQMYAWLRQLNTCIYIFICIKYLLPGWKIPVPGLTFLCLWQCTNKVGDLNQMDFNTGFQVFTVMERSAHRSLTGKVFRTGAPYFWHCDIHLYGFDTAPLWLSCKIQESLHLFGLLQVDDIC